MIPHRFFSLSDKLDFLGVTLNATYTLTQRVNGEALKERIQKVVGPWRGGRFMCLNMRPHSVNNYAFSKLLYKCNTIHPRVEDKNFFSMTAKSFISADLLEKPNKHVLHQEIKDGCLGLICISSRAKAAFITTFLQTAINPNFIRNSYHNLLYRHFVLEEQTPIMIRPPYFGDGFFETIRRLKSSIPSIELISIKGVYDFLVSSTLRAEIQVPGIQGSSNPADWPLIPLTCEARTPETNWIKTWRLARQRGLGPKLTSFILKMLWRIIPTRVRLHRIKPRLYPTPTCLLCPMEETLEHALGDCEANLRLPERLLQVLQVYQPGASYQPGATYSGDPRPRAGTQPRAPHDLGDRDSTTLDPLPEGRGESNDRED